jgi:hypothetical protein
METPEERKPIFSACCFVSDSGKRMSQGQAGVNEKVEE